MAKKFYAVKHGRSNGVFTSWDKCKQQVTGFSGAVYKGFDTEAEARAFVSGVPSFELPPVDTAAAYVDGSYSDAAREFAYGVVLFHNNVELRLSKKFCDSELSELHNVAGEIKGAEKAMSYCIENGIKNLEIYHDYEGVAHWCTGKWAANKPGTKAYKAFYDSIRGRLNVTFHKVKGHSGNIYNEAADELARAALGI